MLLLTIPEHCRDLVKLSGKRVARQTSKLEIVQVGKAGPDAAILAGKNCMTKYGTTRLQVLLQVQPLILAALDSPMDQFSPENPQAWAEQRR
jgi:hypothetical protein